MIAIANIGRAVPSVGWLGIVFPFTLLFFGRNGLGFLPALIALVALAIPPMVTNTYAGLREVDRDLVEAGRGMGMREMELLRTVEVPVALPVILAGIRVSAVQTVATATLASIVGGGTLGEFIVQGIFVRALDRVVGAAILVAALAILTELAFSWIQRRAVSPGLSGRSAWSPMEPGQMGRLAASSCDAARTGARTSVVFTSEPSALEAGRDDRGPCGRLCRLPATPQPRRAITIEEEKPNADSPHGCPWGGDAGAGPQRLLVG